MKPAITIFARLREPFIAALTAIFVFAPIAAQAQAEQPFDLEPSSWIAFDRYKEKPKNWIPPEVRALVATEPVVAPPPTLPPEMPMITQPKRPLMAPAMPGVNKDFEVSVGSTADDRDSPLVLDADKTAELSAPVGSWKDAMQFAHSKKQPGIADEDGPLNVRFTALPPMMSLAVEKPKKLTPKPPPQIAETKVPEQPPAASAPTSPQAKPPAPAAATAAAAASPPAKPPALDPAQCAAIDAYKQRQLAAIESDRRTLEALQKAINTLGLNKQLDFMTGANGSVNAQQIDKPPAQEPAKN